jgi:hypothetical protein
MIWRTVPQISRLFPGDRQPEVARPQADLLVSIRASPRAGAGWQPHARTNDLSSRVAGSSLKSGLATSLSRRNTPTHFCPDELIVTFTR